MLSSCSGILAQAIRVVFISLQQSQSISLALFLQCPHFHQSRFHILICNKTAAEACVQFQKQPSEVFCKIGVLKNFANFTGKHLCWSLLLIKLFSCEFFELFKSIFFYRTPPVAASVLNRSRSTPSIKKAFRKISENSQENICSDIDVFRCIL